MPQQIQKEKESKEVEQTAAAPQETDDVTQRVKESETLLDRFVYYLYGRRATEGQTKQLP